MDFGFKRPWDLEQLRPNDSFPIPACVAFARRAPRDVAVALGKEVEHWEGRSGDPDVTRTVVVAGADSGEGSPYRELAAQGASLVPRCLTFVEEIENPALIRAPGTVMVNPRRGKQDKTPWRDLDRPAITGRTIERVHVFSAVLGESVAPYVTLDPLLVVLPVRRDNGDVLPAGDGDFSVSGGDLRPLGRLMRERWRTVSGLWDDHKQAVNRLTLLGQLDYRRKLGRQLAWRGAADTGACRIVYTKSGRPTAARLRDRDAIVDHTLYWMPCDSDQEAAYLLALINSDCSQGGCGAAHVARSLGGTRSTQTPLEPADSALRRCGRPSR